MAITEADIKVIIAAELKKQGFDKAAKATTNLEASFKRLGKTIASVFAVREIIRFGKASVQAFAQAEKESAQLRSQLTSLNMAFATPVLDDYIDRLELLTGRTGGDLVTAFNQLSFATQDVTTAQKLLNLALDVSAATGKDLGTVSTALQRAYKGEATAIARLRVGLSTAELKGKKFAFVIEELERRFGGASKRNANSFASSIDRLRRSFEQAQEAIGKGFVKGLEKSDTKIEDVQKTVIKLGEALGTTAAAFTDFTVVSLQAIDDFTKSTGYKAFRDFADFLFRQANFVVTGELLVPKKSTGGDQMRKNEKAAAAELRARNQILKQEKKNADLRKKMQTEEEKRQRLETARKRAQTIFDMENIQIVAAMQGKVDGEQRMRLVALLALNTENYLAAEKLSDIIVRLNEPALNSLGVMVKAGDTIDQVVKNLIMSQAKLAGLQLMAEDFPELENPFAEWEDSLENMLKLLMQILAMTKVKGGVYPYSTSEGRAANPYGAVNRGEYSNSSGDLILRTSATGTGMTFNNSNLMPNAGSASTSPTVIVNVAGNVTTQNDLVSSITNALYQRQKDGQSILYSSTAI